MNKILSKKPMTFHIKKCDVNSGVPGDKNHCVVANSLSRELGEVIQCVSVGSNATVVWTESGKAIKYKTPHSIGSRLAQYDKTGKWDLPIGEYTLLPYPVGTAHPGSGPSGTRLSTTPGQKPRKHSRFITIHH